MATEIEVLDVRLHGQSVGSLTRLPGDRVIFAFDEAYVANPHRVTLSLSFKDAFGALITQSRPTQTRLPPFFSNLLPEGPMREYLAERAGVKMEREFFLMWVLGRDLPGALEIVPAHDRVELPDREELGEIDQKAEGGALRFSLAGVQLKFSAVQKATGGLTIPVDGVGGSWIVKVPSARFAGIPENEFAMMTLAQRVGIDVPKMKLIPVEDISGLPAGIEAVGETAFAIKRFDRGDDGAAIHIEDFAQVFGVYPGEKYEKASYRNIAEVLWIEAGQEAIQEFVRRLVFNALIGNADMHLKNWSLIYGDRRKAELSPAYDFVSTITYLPDDKMALSLAGSKLRASLTMDQFERFAAKAKLPLNLVLDTVAETVRAFAIVWNDTKDELVHEKIRVAIDSNLQTLPLWKDLVSKR